MARPAPFPHHYAVRLTEGRLVAAPRPAIPAGPPPEFGGSGNEWSPEELLVAAVLECLWTTFLAYARHDRLEVRGWSGSGVGTLEKGSPIPAFSSIALTVELDVASADEERARRLLATAEHNCIIANALRVPVTLEVSVRAS